MRPLSQHPAFVNTQATSVIANSEDLADLRLVVKDLFHIQGLPTAAGNPDWLASHAIPDTTNSTVQRMLEAGAQYVGKTLTDELAYSLNGLNRHYADLVNPITPSRLPGGSSSGSAVAVASELADIGLGTDTGGSIRVPASYNGLFGLRTSHGLIPSDNMVALAPSFDTVGWMCTNINTLERIAQFVLPASTHDLNQQYKLIMLGNLIDKAEHGAMINEYVAKIGLLNASSAQLDIDALHTSETFRTLQGYEIWQQHGDWITQYQPSFAHDIHARFMWCKSLTKNDLARARIQQRVINAQVNALLEQNNILVLPTTPGRAPLRNESNATIAQYREDLMGLTAIAGLGGLPQIHLPLFTYKGAPCGVSLIGKKNSDLHLITMARKFISQAEPLSLSNDTV